MTDATSAGMRATPINLRAWEVKAILEGRKTMWRGLALNGKDEPTTWAKLRDRFNYAFWGNGKTDYRELLWVRETWCPVYDPPGYFAGKWEEGDGEWIDYRATPRYSEKHPAGWDEAPDDPEALKWRPSIHMPRWASRLTLEVTATKLERLKDISEEDARAEGVDRPILPHWAGYPFKSAFRGLWNDLHGPGAWEANPLVVALSFNVHTANVDDVLRRMAA